MYTLFLLSFFPERGTHTGSGQIGRLRNARVHTIYLSEVWADRQTFRVSWM
jgi:hypothetical protein